MSRRAGLVIGITLVAAACSSGHGSASSHSTASTTATAPGSSGAPAPPPGAPGATAPGATTPGPTASGQTAPANRPPPTRATFDQEATPTLAALDAFDRTLAAVDANQPGTDLSAAAAQLATRLRKTDDDLKSVAWPSPASDRVNDVMTADGTAEADLDGVPNLTPQTVPAWESRYRPDGAAVRSALANARQALP